MPGFAEITIVRSHGPAILLAERSGYTESHGLRVLRFIPTLSFANPALACHWSFRQPVVREMVVQEGDARRIGPYASGAG